MTKNTGGTIESTLGVLTIDTGSSIGNAGTLQANGGQLSFPTRRSSDLNALRAINNSLLALAGTTVINTGGAITVAAGSTLALNGGDNITDGTLTHTAEVHAHSDNGLHHVGITNNAGGTIESTLGVLTIDAGSSIGNAGTLQANGGELDLTDATLTNTLSLHDALPILLALAGTTVINTGGAITVAAGSTLALNGGDNITD